MRRQDRRLRARAADPPGLGRAPALPAGRAAEPGAGLAPANPGDFDNDGNVGFSDFILFANTFGAYSSDANYAPISDLNADGHVGFPDFILFANVFGTFY